MTTILRGSDNFDSARAAPIIARFNLAGVATRELLNIPAWVGKITVDYVAVAGGTNLTIPRVQLGIASGTYPTAYAGAVIGESAGSGSAGTNITSAGFLIYGAWSDTTSVASGQIVLTRVLDAGVSSRWGCSVNSGHSTSAYAAHGGGYGDYSGVVDRLRFTSNGANFIGGDIVVRMEE